MKKVYLILAAAVGMTITSCTTNDYLGDVNNDQAINDGSIKIGAGFKALTRADHVGADAAAKLNNKFYVVGFHGDGATVGTMTQVFDNYLVQWGANTAGTTESNTSDWEYVGLTAPAWSGITGKAQTIKYWDYSSAQYDFIAWSPGTATPVTTAPGAGEVQISKPTPGAVDPSSAYAPSYTLTGLRDDLAKCYIADMVTAYKADKNPVQPKYQKEVQLTFRNLACKVRMALYETIPGYSVKDVKFYVDDATTTIATGATLTNANLFTSASEDKDYFFTKGTYTVSFPTKGDAKLSETDYNKAHVAFAATAKDSKEDFGALNYVGKESNEEAGNHYLGRSLPNASYAGTSAPYYKTMLPNEDGTVLELRVDYTLLATDGSGETINIHGAKAFVPIIYAQWKPNYAYTYVFKISDNTNGWTSTVDTDPQGLYPITFDAVVVDADEFKQSTITTVAYPSITTYQKGHNTAVGDGIINIDEYDKDKGKIYVQVMKNGTLANDLNETGISKLYTLGGKTAYTEADVLDALNIQVSATGTPLVITGRNSVTLTEATITNTITAIPGVNGNDIEVTANTAAEFTPAAGTYAYVYDTKTYGGQLYTLKPDGFPTGYYTDATCETPASTFTASTTYYQKSSEIRSYNLLSAAPADWNAVNNVYYTDAACTTKINSAYANPSFVLSEEPADWNASNNVYYSDAACETQANTAFASGTYYKKLSCYRKYTVNNKIYGVKVIKVVE